MANNIDTQVLNSLGLSRELEQTKDSNELGQEDFMQLLISQLSNQNPLEPEDPGAFLGQLAQFGTVDGIGKLNTTIDSLASSFQSSQALEATMLVGRSVMVDSNQLYLQPGVPSKLGIELPSTVSELKLSIEDASGNLVREIPIGSKGAGIHHVTWDGLDDSGNALPAGEYRMRATAVQGDEEIAHNTLFAANVNSVTVGQNGQFVLNLPELGKVRFDQVKEVL